MRVALVAEQLRRRNPGGIGTYARELSRTLANRSTAVELVASRPRRGDDPLQSIAPLTVTPFGHRVTTRLWDHDLLRLDGRVAGNVDILHATSFHYPNPNRGPGSPALTVFVHDLAWRANPEHFTERGVRFHEAALGRSLRLAQHLLVPSQRTADQLVRAGAPARKVTVVSEGCDHLPPPSSRAVPPNPEHPYLLTVSTIEPRKNLPALLRAFASARSSLPPGTVAPRLVIVGATGWTGRSTALPDTVPDGVELRGSVSEQELSDLLAGALGFVYVPLLEGFGLPPVEAMRAGVPCVVSSTVPSVTETPHSPVLLADPLDVSAMTEALQRLVTDEVLRADLRVRGLEHAATRTWAASADQHVALWSSL